MLKRLDNVKLIKRCDSPSLQVGDEGQAVSEVQEDGMVAVAFDFDFDGAHNCDGLLSTNCGWWVNVDDLAVED